MEEDVGDVVGDATAEVRGDQLVYGLNGHAGVVSCDDGRRKQGERLVAVGGGGFAAEYLVFDLFRTN